MRKALYRIQATERGQATVELAMVLPVLVLLLLGVYFFARAFSLQQVLSAAAHEGARVWARNPPGGAWYQCGNIPCADPDADQNNFYVTVIPAVKNYIRNSGYSETEVLFYTTQANQQTTKIRENVSALDASNDRVTITIYYPYKLPLGSLGNFTQVYLRASCTLKRG